MNKPVKHFIFWAATLLVFSLAFAWIMFGHGLRVAHRLSLLHVIKRDSDMEILYSSSRNREAYHILRLRSDSIIAGTPAGMPVTKVNLEFVSSDQMLASVFQRVGDHTMSSSELLRLDWYYGSGKELLADVFIAKSVDGFSILYVSFY